MPRFSIIIPCYNAQDTLGATLESLRTQTCQDWQAICIDDRSQDNTYEIAAKVAACDPRIKLLRNQGNGPSEARNLGAMTVASGDLIAFCDADDLWQPDKLADINLAFENPQVDGVFGQITFFKDTPQDGRVRSTVPKGPLTIAMLIGENPVCTMSNITVRKDIFTGSGGFDRTMVHNEDLDWLIRIIGAGAHVVGRPKMHVWYRTRATGLSADLDAMAKGRATALTAAARFGQSPSRRTEAIYLRSLARRSLRLGQGRIPALRYALAGLRNSPLGFLSPPRRGILTLIASLITVVLPRRLSIALFAR